MNGRRLPVGPSGAVHPDRRSGPRFPWRGWSAWTVIWGLLLLPGFTQAAGNRLQGNASPYLALHADDPVNWQPWGRAALEQARREDKLLYISSGYFSCHWCHVMQRESYSDPGIAALINRYFVAVKVDRELEPVLDAQLMEFMQETRGYGGWPLNVFMTPEGYPLLGVVYLPPEDFRTLAGNVGRQWEEERDRLRTMARDASAAIARNQLSRQALVKGATPGAIEQGFVAQAMLVADEMAGGFGQDTKFPSAPQLAALQEMLGKYPGRETRAFLRLTLDQMARNGLRDHLGGGFFRYTMDPAWQQPHFEKMLYDNAQLARLYLSAGEVFADDRYRAIALETLDFVLRDMASRDGAFIASLSAVDEKGAEGAYYLWGPGQLGALLDREELRVVSLAWAMKGPAPFEHGYLPYEAMSPTEVAASTGLQTARVETLLASARAKLLRGRARRSLPRDTKRLTAWNGLMLGALSDAAARTKRFRAAAQDLQEYLLRIPWQGGELQRAVDGRNEGLGPAELEDYAHVADGLLAWARISGKAVDYEAAAAVAAEGWRRFHTAEGWRASRSSLIPRGPPRRHIPDGPVASPSATLLRASMALIDRPQLRPHADAILDHVVQVSRGMVTEPFFHATQIATMSRYTEDD